MENLISLWQSLDTRRRVVGGLGLITVVVCFVTLVRLASAPSLALLYAGLEPDTAGDVVQALEQADVAYEIRGNSVFVDSAMRDKLRMTLASQGLPQQNGQGYELLDTLSGFGTTAQMFDVAYWRAKEGELARTIAAGSTISAARVHISNANTGPFGAPEGMKASVTAVSANGPLSSENAKALRYLVSSAVAGLAPDHVSVIDGRSGVVVPADSETAASQNDGLTDRLRKNVERLLAARVGSGNAVVEINVETVTDSEVISEKRFDPDSRVAISSETKETSTQSDDTRAGSVTVASNLPQGDATAGNNSSSSNNSETTQRTNFEVSETRREIVRTPGAIKKISAAVLVNGVITTDEATGITSWAPRSDAELQTLSDLVKSAIGFDEARGDSVTLKTLEFENGVASLAPPQPSFFERLNLDVMRLIQLAVLGGVATLLALFVLRPILTSSTRPLGLANQAELDNSGPRAITPSTADVSSPTTALTGEISELSSGQIHATQVPALQNASSLPEPASASGDPVDRLRQMIEDRQEETVEILRGWIEDGEEKVP